jgi:glycosyltransferase involved in cell wall biosynthesis
LFPRVSNKNGGIFITSRLREYRKFKISFDVVSLTYKDDFLVRALKKILRKVYNDPLKEIEGIDYKVFRWSIIKYLFYKLGLLNLFRSLCKSIEKKFDLEQYDIIHAHGMYGDVPAGLIAKFLAEKYNKPFVVTLHGSDVNVLMPQRSSEYKRVLESSSANIFVSKALLEKAKSYGYSGKNAVVIPNGYDPSIFYSVDKEGIRNELGILKKDYKYLGFVGNLVYIKRADKLGEILITLQENTLKHIL